MKIINKDTLLPRYFLVLIKYHIVKDEIKVKNSILPVAKILT